MTKILLIGIDGLNLPTAIEGDAPPAPTLASLIARGAYARMTVEVPTWSGPSWATLLTGATYAEHGITENTLSGHRLGPLVRRR